MKLPRSRTRQQRAAWIGVIASGAAAALAFAGALHFSINAPLADAWFGAFIPEYQAGWAGGLGRVAEIGLAVSIVFLLIGAGLGRSIRSVFQWVGRGE
ncbi:MULTISPECIES: hypothetical protein [unclassified Paraburkholderia]|uniref:hypothetical protein n=1 Tax=unclassified Paraburkholderia TaxID=2615204 RepID=UPI002AB1007A|nr:MULTISPECIES: hypothetical protein [unclassified Paraburkholderia]